jgi:CheY-like chemotaxis protein
VANNGREACDLVTSSSFDLIYMDMQMPEMSGVEATRCIRAQGHTLPIVALTANATEQDRQLCRQSGFDDFVTKPIVRDSLYQVTARYLRSASSSAADA